MKAASVQDGKLYVDMSVCNNCGRCLGKCPFGAAEESVTAYRVYIGGRWGKKSAIAQPLDRLFTDPEEVLNVIEKCICLFRDEGISGERFADTIARLGFDYVQNKVRGE